MRPSKKKAWYRDGDSLMKYILAIFTFGLTLVYYLIMYCIVFDTDKDSTNA